MRIRRSLIALAVSLIGFWGCSGDSDNGGTTNTDETEVKTPGDGQLIATLPDTTTSPVTTTLPHTTTSPDATTSPVTTTLPAATVLLDLSYISDDFGIALILRPAAILSTDLASHLPTGLLSDKMIKQTTIDPHDLEQVVVLLALPEGIEEYFDPTMEATDAIPERPAEGAVEGVESAATVGDDEPGAGSEFAPSPDRDGEFESPPEPITGVILRSRTPFDKTKLLESIFGEDIPEPVEHDGKQYYKNEYNPSVYFPDEITLVMATTSVLPSMMSADDVDGPLIRQLKITDADHDAVLVAVVEPFREKIEKVAAAAGFPPPVTDAIGTLVFNAAAVTASVDVSGDRLCCLRLLGQDEVGARNLEAFVRAWFESGSQMFADMKGNLVAETSMDLGGLLVTVVEQVIAGINIEKKGLEVVVVIERPPALDDLAKQLEPAINAARERAENAP